MAGAKFGTLDAQLDRSKLGMIPISSIGFGLYRGSVSDKGDELWRESLDFGLNNGINLIDTAQKYRNGRSEEILGAVVNELFKTAKLKRENVFIISKVGLLPNYVIKSKIIESLGVSNGNINLQQSFCIDPLFVDWSVENSLKMTGLDYLDGYLLHNPEIAMLFGNGEDMIIKALEVLEKKSIEGKIKYYGIATWNGLRRKQGSKYYLDLLKILNKIKKYFGETNNFRIVEAPLSLGMPTILSYKAPVDNKYLTLQEIINDNKIMFLSSASLYEGHIKELLELNRIFSYDIDSPIEDRPARVSFPESENSLKQLLELLSNLKQNRLVISDLLSNLGDSMANNIIVALDIVRSTSFVKSALVGMENIKYTRENICLLNKSKINTKKTDEYWNRTWKNK